MMKYLTGGILLIAFGYGLVEAWPLLAGPMLTLESPIENGTYPDGVVRVVGKAERAARLTINGQAALHDQNGIFAATLAFPPGGSILTVAVADRFGRTITETRTIFVP